jgi:glycosyltransferase involved in cell wall biosynthesis
MKICYIISRLDRQGPVNVLLNKLRYFDFSTVEVSIITLKKEGKNSLYDEFRRLGVRLYPLDFRIKYNLFVIYKKVKNIIGEINPDVVHSLCFRSLMVNSFLGKEHLSFHTIHSYPGDVEKIMYGQLTGKIMKELTRNRIKKIDCSIACSDTLREKIIILDNIKVESIRNGVPPVEFDDCLSKNEMRQKLNLKGDKKYFISVGRFSEEKNFEFLIRNFNRNKRHDIGLIILGDGPFYNCLKKYEDENIILPGFVTDVYKYLRASDYYVSTSITEGMPMSVLEAMSVGLPMILSDIKAHMEILMSACKDEPVGFSFKNNYSEDFNNQVDSLCGKDYGVLSDNAKMLFSNKFSARIMSKAYFEKYARLLERSKKIY